MKKPLTIPLLHTASVAFAKIASKRKEPLIYGTTDGKAIGTYLELEFKKYLSDKFHFEEGNAARGIDLPSLSVDIKTTSIKQP